MNSQMSNARGSLYNSTASNNQGGVNNLSTVGKDVIMGGTV